MTRELCQYRKQNYANQSKLTVQLKQLAQVKFTNVARQKRKTVEEDEPNKIRSLK